MSADAASMSRSAAPAGIRSRVAVPARLGFAVDAPAPDEIELAVFGRGVGEAITLHLGGGDWVAVDSARCADGTPVALAYLDAIGVSAADALRLIVVSHWDSDHIRGIAEVFRAASAANVVLAPTLQEPRLVRMIRRSGRPKMPEPERRNVDEFAAIFAERDRRASDPLKLAGESSLLWSRRDARVWSVAPSSETQLRSLERLLHTAERGVEAPRGRRNVLSVVLWIEVGAHRLLLGGDLERRPRSAWHGVLDAEACRGQRASAFKVAHHGSRSGHLNAVWERLLTAEPWAALTAHANHGLPSEDDRRRIRRLTPCAWVAGVRTAGPGRDEETRRLAQEGSDGKLEPLAGPIGMVRLRAPLAGADGWREAVLGNAEAV